MGDDFSLDLGNCAIDTQKMKSENSNLLTTQFNSKSVDLSIVWNSDSRMGRDLGSFNSQL